MKVENCERLFSLSSTTCKTSSVLEDSLSREQVIKAEVAPTSKRRRPMGGMTKSGGKHLMAEPPIEEESDSDDNEAGDESGDDSILQGGRGKKKKIAKSGHIRKG